MEKKPSGTVTFLFTDIEGSTDLWERFPEQMPRAFERQESILRETVAKHDGYAYKMIGDAFQIAFKSANSALCAALEAQQRLQAEAWGKTPIRVRMALHTGITEERGDDYVGPALNRIGRLLDLSHGGQVLLTQATRQLVADNLPADASLRDLGEQRFKDMQRAEHIYQLEAPGLPVDFPALQTSPAALNNLPMLLTSFIGRQTEMIEIKLLLVVDKYRLVTLTGSGGTGKTRLALRVAAELLEGFRDGVWWVELAPLADPALIPQTVTTVLGVRDVPGKPKLAMLIQYLRTKQLLLILDNCEHVIETVSQLANSLLQACPELQILATSREILGVEGEAPYRVPSLSFPDLQRLPELQELAEYEAIHLFCERASQAAPGFLLTKDNAPLVAQICSRLDGIPLAIELAAARVRLLSLEQIATRLSDSFRLLTGGSRTALPRHQTLKALIDWSYKLLSAPERTLLVNLSVFAGGWTLEAAEEVCGVQAGEDVFQLLVQLVDKSLVLALQEGRSEARYYLLETIRQYTREKSIDIEGVERVRDQHLDYYLNLSRQAEPHLRSTDQAVWLDSLEIELDNLRQALEWSLSRRILDGLQLGTALLWFWHIRGHGSEGINWLEKLLEAEVQLRAGQSANAEQQLIRAQALNAVGFLCAMQNQYAQGKIHLDESLGIFRSLDTRGEQGLASTLMKMAGVMEDVQKSLPMLEESLEISRRLGDKFTAAEALQNIAGIMMEQGRFTEATQAVEEDLSLRIQINDLDGMGTAYMIIGEIAFFQGRHAEADENFAEGQEYFRMVGNKQFVSRMLFSQAMVAFSAGDFERASQLCEQAIAIGHELREKTIVAVGLFRLGRVSSMQGNYELANSQFKEVLKIAEETGYKAIQAWAHFGLATLDITREDYFHANEHLKECVAIWREVKDDWDVGLSLVVLVDQAYRWQRYQTCAELIGAIDSILPPFGLNLLFSQELKTIENIRFAVQEAMGATAYQKAWSGGHQKTLNQVLDLVLELSQEIHQQHSHGLAVSPTAQAVMVSQAPEAEFPSEPLSGRELEVLKLIAAGATNQEIARKLYIDLGTVKSHNTHIFNKLGVKNRTQAANLARRRGLL